MGDLLGEALPIHAVLPGLLAALRAGPNAVLVAPPGAGKTTAVAPALLDQPWCGGRILLLSPRRLAARAAAERMAAMAGEPVGRTIGYATRLDSRQSAETRILVLTEGIFRNRIQDDPELAGISAVLFDEVHERSLDSDFGLALALDAQAALRPDLRLVAMSATLDGGRFATLLGGAPLVESEGRSHALTLCHVGRSTDVRMEDAMAAAIRRALAEDEGGLLAFLPGVAEIERTAERLTGLPADIDLHRLHGSLDPADQRAAIAPAAPGRRKLVLATSIAETSLTLDGVRIVVDSGLARRPRYDRAAGMTRLVTERASQAAVTQRAGRAARQAPGTAWRLWEEAATAGLPRFDPPEILEADLSPLLLDCALWGVADPRGLRWVDPPPDAAIAEARARLATLDAIDADGRPTAHGRAIAALPLPPRLAHMMVVASGLGWGRMAADMAVLLSERGLGGHDADLETRLRRWRSERGKRADGARRLAERWLKMTDGSAGDGSGTPGGCIALAFPDRVAKRRGADGADWISVGGRGFRLDPASSLAREPWLAVAETQGVAAGARILSAAPIDWATIEALFADRIAVSRSVRFDAGSGGVTAERERRLGAVRLASGPDDKADPAAIAAALLDGVRAGGVALLPWSDKARALRQRIAFAAAHMDAAVDISDDALMATLDDWLPPLLAGRRRLGDVDPGALSGVLEGMMGWDARQAVDRIAPAGFTSPAGSHHAIDYGAEGGPRVELRVQALFGLGVHPAVGGGAVPLVLSLTSPAGRPIQTTRDLPGFWAGSWAAVAKEMRGRYPRHPWPDDPAAAAATLRTKRADAR
ncbi:MAG: ATP-dependent helicase HrpB [Sphingomonas sp. SCN 67-18]|uniref:ATP-dependent helicase HrpB n=1 Tax=uncultured Sphingomonas sp. TaxID=158754 RepID=UPI000869B7F7|nr:ATP-dependent helicase HrpB [Sphingomonas sp. SCN 67-18]ODU19972.1 MAG: ATP-dependent helicase HrpB [Sphingomonas sp. SCN 67-18]